MSDKLDSVIGSSVAALVGLILLCSVVIPIGVAQIGSLTGEAAEYAPILGVVIIMSIVGLIIGVIRFFQSKN